MSLFNKIKAKNISDPQPAETMAKEPEELPAEPFTMEHLMAQLYKHKETFPEDITAIQPYLDEIQYKSKERIELQRLFCTQAAADTSEEVLPPCDADVEILVTPDHMTAFVYILPPVGDGFQITEATILQELADREVTCGIDSSLAAEIADLKAYYTIYAIARGTAPTNGSDGYVIDYFSRNQAIHLSEDERGVIDYKSLNIFQNISAGDKICDIIYPTEGVDGVNVKGGTLIASPGKMPVIPKGKHTSLNEEENALFADIAGDLSFVNNLFRIEPQLVIQENVDSTTGNLDFTGDILIKGDVCKGFSVKAEGNVIIYGMAESSFITAGEDITIKEGMNGGNEGTLTAGGNICSRFLEQTFVTAGGNVRAETIVNCHIKSGGSILALDGKGSIIAGSLCASQCVEAKRIGNLSNIKTDIKIGYSVLSEENVEFLISELKTHEDTFEKLNKNILFLEGLPRIPDDKQELYQTLLEQKQLYTDLITQIDEKIQTISSQRPDYTLCHVRGDIIYGITKVSLGYSTVLINESLSKCNISFIDGELSIGTF